MDYLRLSGNSVDSGGAEHGRTRGDIIESRDAVEYAMKECGITVCNPDAPDREEFERALVEWYFSGGDWGVLY